MQFVPILSLIFSLALSLSSVSASGHSDTPRRHHSTDVSSVRAAGDLQVYDKRGSYDNSRFTYFADGLGACGATSQPGDFIVALNSDQYGSGGFCYKSITISYAGKTTTAIVVDECPGCPYGALDFSTGLFEFFSPLSVGVIYGDWWFN
ncbi:RlpA-like double-psi beta-barrel-protein domain-containing protein-containing protein [Hygrophoropsis aurantiaca]|uniref:RlpA-like double-psi beta-barrel-protein domain-containing protein-containing protein n=1 Tax=Hygrophoropsis aurantiaca TaxID=72124 RepID=A0ACB8A6U9_9AGAM|nr:RlpA-like double-psi beta-barrel-protein domain-containing protein-containing protein [Hygrophoropsis aurantiaca]